jgi:ELWxxDGT repeat protein
VTNGSYWGTGLVSDIRPGTFGSNPRDLTVAGGTLFFTANINETGRELWSLQATGVEPELLRDIRVGTETSGANRLLSHNGNLYFVADDGANGTEVWRSSGSQDSTELAFDINPTGSSHPSEFTVLGEKIYVLADDGSRGVEIWFLAENEDIHLSSN